jgi:transketolase
MRRTFINLLTDEYLIVPDVGYGVVEVFHDKHPDKFINVGICEQLAINIAVGLALSGKKVYVYGIATYILYRALDQIRNYVSHLKLDITIVGTGKDMTYKGLDSSHWAIDDKRIIGDMMPIYEPETEDEMKEIMSLSGPKYIRIK